MKYKQKQNNINFRDGKTSVFKKNPCTRCPEEQEKKETKKTEQR